MKRKLKLAAVLASTVLSLWGCQMKKEDTVNVVTEQPVLGVDVTAPFSNDSISEISRSA